MGIAAGAIAAAQDKKLKVVSESTARGFAFPESVAYDGKAKVLYMGQFGGEKLDTTSKDGNGKISKLSLDGKVIEERFLPAGDDKLNKPKGIWVHGNRLWVTDIDSLWVFDLKTRKGKKLELTGITFANDVTVMGHPSLDEYIAEHKEGDVVTGRMIDAGGSRARVELGEGVQAACRMGAADEQEEKAAAPASADLSSLSSMLAAKWKGGAQKREPARYGQVRSFRIVKLDPAQKKIEVELA